MEPGGVNEDRSTAVCKHGVKLAPLDVYLAAQGGLRSMYCADCRRDEQDEIDSELRTLAAGTDETFTVDQLERLLDP
jgi:hypothetical protein